MQASKIRIRMGEIEVEYEGSSSFSKKELLDLLGDVSKLHDEKFGNEAKHKPKDDAKSTQVKSAPTSTSAITSTTNAIAKKLGAKTANDLMYAAATKLSFVDGLDSFSKKQLQKEMRSATRYFKANMANYYGQTLSRVIDNDLLTEVGTDQYSIPDAARDKLESKLV